MTLIDATKKSPTKKSTTKATKTTAPTPSSNSTSKTDAEKAAAIKALAASGNTVAIAAVKAGLYGTGTPSPTQPTSTKASQSTSSTSKPATSSGASGASGTTYKLVDPSGKVLSSTYSAADKASMEKMGLASGYKFVPANSGAASGGSSPSISSKEPAATQGKAIAETSSGGTGAVYVAKIPYQTSSGTQYLRLTQKQVNDIWAKDPSLAEKYGLPDPTGDDPVQEDPMPTQPMPGENDDYEYDNSAIFMGNETLVTFTGSPQVWLVNKEEKTIRPFASMQAFNNAFGDNAAAALAIASNISDMDLGPSGVFEGYTILDGQYAIKEDGSALKYDNSKQAMRSRYRNEINVEGEQMAYMMLDGFLDLLVADKSGLNPDTINKIKNDDSKIAFYLNALAYGGYGLADVYRDLKRQELIDKGGSSELNNLSPISASQTRSVYSGTKEGKAAYENVKISPPADLVGMNLATLNLPIYNMPDEAFKTLVPLLDWNSDEFKAKMDEVQSAYHDVIMQQLSAKTEQDKALADYNWSKFKEEVARTYGIQLSDNAYEAWNQLEQARDTFSQRGVVGSGLEAESVDDYLRRVRTVDQRSRDERAIRETSEEANYLLSYGTPAQIQAMINEDRAKGLPQSEWRATKLGLIPSAEVKAGLSFDALKKKYPDMSDEEITRHISSILDENGNYRSTLYQNYMTNKIAEEDRFKQYQMDTVLAQELQKEEDAYKQFTASDSPFLREAGEDFSSQTDAVKLKMPSGMQVQDTYKNLSTPSGLTGGEIAGQPKDKYGTGTPTMPGSTKQVNAPVGQTPTAKSPQSLYRDGAGNIVNSSGEQVISAGTLSKLSPEMQQNLVKNAPVYSPTKTPTQAPVTTSNKPVINTGSSKPTSTGGTKADASRVTIKTPTGSTIQTDAAYMTPEKRANLVKNGYSFL